MTLFPAGRGRLLQDRLQRDVRSGQGKRDQLTQGHTHAAFMRRVALIARQSGAGRAR
jgi:hypothetical protein